MANKQAANEVADAIDAAQGADNSALEAEVEALQTAVADLTARVEALEAAQEPE